MTKKAKADIQMPENFTTNPDLTNTTSKKTSGSELPLLFTKKNYQLMAIGLGVIFLGYLLMLGKNNNVEGGTFPAEDIYSARRIILAPFVIVIGFLIEVYAIISAKKNS